MNPPDIGFWGQRSLGASMVGHEAPVIAFNLVFVDLRARFAMLFHVPLSIQILRGLSNLFLLTPQVHGNGGPWLRATIGSPPCLAL